MQLGMHLRELWRLRLGLILSVAVAVLVGLWTSFQITLSPPGLRPRTLSMASATTHVLVDNAQSITVDLRQQTSDFTAETNRAVLLGNVMGSLPVRDYIARRAHIAPEALMVSPPLTPEFPRPVADADHQKKTSDLLRSLNQYRLDVRTNPVVPVIDVYTQAPTAKGAEELANASVDGLRDYLAAVAKTQNIAPSDQVRLTQLGRAHGGVLNGGAKLQSVILSSFFTLVLACLATLFISRVRAGWRAAEESERDEQPAAPPGHGGRSNGHSPERAPSLAR